MRTTIDLEPVLLAELRRRGRVENKTLGQVVGELIAPALKAPTAPGADFAWGSDRLDLVVDLEDGEMTQTLLDREEVSGW